MTARLARSVLAVTASAVLLLTAPGLVGVAVAHDNGGGGSSQAHNPISPDLQMAIKDARIAYLSAVKKATADYRDALIRIRTSIQAETASQLKAVQDAKTALDEAAKAGKDQATLDQLRQSLKSAIDSYRNSVLTTKSAHETDVAGAQQAANDAIGAAGIAYAKTVTGAFAKFAPGMTPPPGLLKPPGRGFGKGQDMNHGGLGLHLDQSNTPSRNTTSGRGSGDDD
jgi:hypothetical protein